MNTINDNELNNIKLIALDLDGTLLNSDKQLSKANFEQLDRLASQGIEIVPTTGRFYGAMPEEIRKLPFVHYVIAINGAQVLDVINNKTIARAEIPLDEAVEIMEYLDELPVAYDCYMEGRAWMTQHLKDGIEEYLSDSHFLKMVRELRQPVPELRTFISSYGSDIQKIIMFTKDEKLREKQLKSLPLQFSNLIVSSSMHQNVEINNVNANKGNAIRQLSEYLGIDIKNTMAFGDGLNDLSMIVDAGIGVAMSNASKEVLNEADIITKSNDEDGVACVLRQISVGE